jgi:hypothetical protein
MDVTLGTLRQRRMDCEMSTVTDLPALKSKLKGEARVALCI